MSEKNYSIKENTDYFGWLEGKAEFPLFGRTVRFHVKGNNEVYARRCAEYFEDITAENLTEHNALCRCLKALVQYVADMLDEHSGEFDLGDAVFDGDSTVDDLLNLIAPESITFECSSFVSEEECPIAYSIKFCFTPVPDEVMEIALHGDVAVYAGEYRNVSAWNDKLLKKKYNYLR